MIKKRLNRLKIEKLVNKKKYSILVIRFILENHTQQKEKFEYNRLNHKLKT